MVPGAKMCSVVVFLLIGNDKFIKKKTTLDPNYNKKVLCTERKQLYKRHDVIITISKTLYTRPTHKELVEVANN